ncbi:MAG: hypothetical protein HY721_04570, partial [Planctomycetes bacterium]|nr:hypothetical protein [Planctomycetota bacterium]
VRVKASLAVGLKGTVKADVVVVVRATSPYLEVDVLVDPKLEAWASGAVHTDVFWGIVSATGEVVPTVGLRLPLKLKLEGVDLKATVESCLRLALGVKVKACINYLFGSACLESGVISLADAQAPTGCWTRGGGGVDVSDSPVPELRMPALATSPDGLMAFVAYVEDMDPTPGYRPEIHVTARYGESWEGGGWLPPRPLLHDAGARYFQKDPQAAFVSDHEVLVVWTQSKLSREELERVGAAMPAWEAFNWALSSEEIHYALYDLRAHDLIAAEWLTDNDLPEGKAKVAAIPFHPDGAAVVAWVSYDVHEVLDDEGNARLGETSVCAQVVSPSGPLDAEWCVSFPGNGAADLEPALAVSPSGRSAYLVWVEDADADFTTPEDRRLLCARWTNDGGAGYWSEPIAAGEDWPAAGAGGPLMPSIALHGDGDGVLAFTAKPWDASTSELLSEDRVLASRLAGGLFQPPEPLGRGRRSRALAGQWPVAAITPGVAGGQGPHAAVVFRELGEAGADGDVALASLDVSDPDAKWSPVKAASGDEAIDWEIAAAPGPGGRVRIVRSRGPGGAGGPGVDPSGSIAATDLVLRPDVKVSSCRASSPYVPAGARVELIATVENAGLAAGRAAQLTVHVRLGSADWTSLPGGIAFDLRPGEATEVRVPVRMPPEGVQAQVRLGRHPDEIDGMNNAAACYLGVPPPAGLSCADASTSEACRAYLRWTNGTPLYDAISLWRDGELRAILPGDVEAHVDEGGLSPEEHDWEVRGEIGLARSAAAAVRCAPRCAGTAFRRSDSNADGEIDISDAIFTLAFLFLGGGEPQCADAADANDDGLLDLSDAVFTIAYLFLGGEPPPYPFPACGPDLSLDALECRELAACAAEPVLLPAGPGR